MSKEIAIEVKNISKSYQIPGAYGMEDFYVLDNVSFTLYKGDIMGIIGSNGSGKSTLLKILGEVIKPTTGEVNFFGKATSILDIGDNFHPDLSGRENVNIQLRLQRFPRNKFDEFHQEIRDFSEIGDFYEQPVKVYSAGMFLRLAFSIALHLSADILILDEVLSVGDEGFRLKCKEFLELFAQQGKTILFVSHNRLEVQELSNQCLWLHKGTIRKMGKPIEILGEYFAMHKDNYDAKKMVIQAHPHAQDHLADSLGTINIDWPEENAPGNDILSIQHLSVMPMDGNGALYHSSPILIKFIINKKKQGIHIGAFFFIQDMFYQSVMVGHFLNNSLSEDLNSQIKNEIGPIEITCTIPPNFLIPGKYFLLVRFGMEENNWNPLSEEAFRFSETLSFTIHAKQGYIDFVGDASKGSVRPPLDWKISKKIGV